MHKAAFHLFNIAFMYKYFHESIRIHLMAGRVPVGLQRTAVAKEMEGVFVQNLSYAADVLSKVRDLFLSNIMTLCRNSYSNEKIRLKHM